MDPSSGVPEIPGGGESSLGSGGSGGESSAAAPPSRYESQKRRDWNTFLQYLKNHKPPLSLSRCSGAHVIEFLKYLDQFGKTKVHLTGCAFFGHPNPPAPCACPLKQAWGSLDALIGRLRAAYEENGGRPESNPFGARAVRIYLREVREGQAKARGIPYEKKKRKRPPSTSTAAAASQPEGGASDPSDPSCTTTATASTSMHPPQSVSPRIRLRIHGSSLCMPNLHKGLLYRVIYTGYLIWSSRYSRSSASWICG